MRAPLDTDAIAAAGLGWSQAGSIGTVTISAPTADDPAAREVLATVQVDGGQLLLFPERSAGQRTLINLLGLGAP